MQASSYAGSNSQPPGLTLIPAMRSRGNTWIDLTQAHIFHR